jgi:hypothetical protein
VISTSYENYSLIRDESSVRSGLLEIPFDKFVRVISGNVTSSSPNAMAMINLGIEFPGENGIKYTRAAISYAGAIVLLDPNDPSTTAADAFGAVCTDVTNNTSIKNLFSSASLLLCPWWDPQQSTVASDVYELINSYSNPLIFRLVSYNAYRPEDLYGSEYRLDSSGGVLYANLFNSDRGRCSVIRWCTRETLNDTARILRYETALYENGTIEFRYATPAQKQPSAALPATGSAVVGAFFSSGTHRFRDMSIRDERGMYELGGFIYTASYTNNGAAYCVSNNGHDSWPGNITGKAVYALTPPVSLRKILPRIEIKKQSNVSFSPTYNDRRTVLADTGVVDAPIGLSFLDIQGDGSQIHDLFRKQTHCVRSRSMNDLDFFTTPVKSLRPYCDNDIDDADMHHASASSINTAVPNNTVRLTSRHSIKLAFKISRETKFLPNIATGIVFDPDSESFVLAGVDKIVIADTEARRAAEDSFGFNAVGHYVASGTYSISSQSQSTLSPGLYTQNTNVTKSDLLSAFYNTSITLNDGAISFKGFGTQVEYTPIKTRLNHPFALEAIELELPVKANDAWFRDLTTIKVNFPNESYSGWNLGGPGVTCIVLVDRGSRLKRFRDIVATGSITHKTDYETVSSSITSLGGYAALVNPVGFRTCGGDPAAVINAVTGPYTGSVKLFMPVSTAIGTYMALTGSTTTDVFLKTLPINESVPKSTLAFDWVNAIPVHLSPFGRSHDGVSISARSFIAKEAGLSTSIKQRFYMTGAALTALSSSLNGYTSVTYAGSALDVSSAPSPYILLPNDNIRIMISRARPAWTGSGIDAVRFSNGLDTQAEPMFGIALGEMRLNLIGRYVKEGELSEISIEQNSENFIGNDPVVDQLEFYTATERYGTYIDDYVTGSYLTQTNTGFSQTGERGKVFSIANASSSAMLDTSLYSNVQTKPAWLSGYTHLNFAVCEEERYYDSMLPPIDEIARKNGASILYQSAGFYIVNKPTAVIFYDIPSQHTASIAPYSDNCWSRAFPFEPKYSTLQRRKDMTNFYNCDLRLVNGTVANVGALTNDGVANQLVVIKMQVKRGVDAAGSPRPLNEYFFYPLDAVGNNPPKVVTGPVTNTFQTRNDLIKTLYGIGDLNAVIITGSSGPMGSTNAPDYASYSFDPPSSREYSFGTKPIIRGWKYGLVNGIRTVTKAVWRRDHYGQFRDMLEQRMNAKFANDSDGSMTESPVRVTFLDAYNKDVKDASATDSSNLSYEATSSLPYFDGDVRNR